MLNIHVCEKYARKYDILFNATKSQLLHFSKDSNNDNVQPILTLTCPGVGKKVPPLRIISIESFLSII